MAERRPRGPPIRTSEVYMRSSNARRFQKSPEEAESVAALSSVLDEETKGALKSFGVPARTARYRNSLFCQSFFVLFAARCPFRFCRIPACPLDRR